MELCTAAEVISFAKQLEEKGAKFYEDLAQRYKKDGETLLSFARENRSNVVQIERTYYGVISDALEGCFSFKINAGEYTPKTELVDSAGYSHALNQAVEMEENISKFYSDAAGTSKSLLADIPRAFTMIAKRRVDRRTKLGVLLHNKD